MVRAAAKNHANVAVVTDPSMYADVAEAVAGRRVHAGAAAPSAPPRPSRTPPATTPPSPPGSPRSTRRTAPPPRPAGPTSSAALWSRQEVLRYGENPHQRAALYARDGRRGRHRRGRPAARQGDVLQQLRGRGGGLAGGVRVHRALRSRSSSTPTRAGSRSVPTWPRRTARRHACDPVSAYGGVIAANRPGDGGARRPDRRDLHRGRRRARLRARRQRTAHGQEEPAAAELPAAGRARRRADRVAPAGWRPAHAVRGPARRARRRPGQLGTEGRPARPPARSWPTWPSRGAPAAA